MEEETQTLNLIQQEGAPTTCVFCLEDQNASDIQILDGCSHVGCRQCLVGWIEQAENQVDGPTCPFCRLEMDMNQVNCILGRSFQRKKTAAEAMDDLTEQWLRENTGKCPGCGALIQKNGGCDNMRCFCGETFRYRYDCGCKVGRFECGDRLRHMNGLVGTRLTLQNFSHADRRFWQFEGTQGIADELKQHSCRGDIEACLAATRGAVQRIRPRQDDDLWTDESVLVLFQKMNNGKSAFDLAVEAGQAHAVKVFLGLFILAANPTLGPVAGNRGYVSKTLYQYLDKGISYDSFLRPTGVAAFLGDRLSNVDVETKKVLLLYKYSPLEIKRFCPPSRLSNDRPTTGARPRRSKKAAARPRPIEKKKPHFASTPSIAAKPKKNWPRLVMERDVEQFREVFPYL